MVTISAKIFKKYDIRGQAMGDSPLITPEIAHLIGRAFGTYLKPMSDFDSVVVGRDNRHSSPKLQEALMQGLSSAGITVYDLGLVATPVVYWHAVDKGGIGGVMVTGSHLAGDQNGFKLCIGNKTLYGQNIQALRNIIESNEFSSEQREIIAVEDEARTNYLLDLTSRIPKSRALKVVIDAGNGTGGLFAPELVAQWGHDVLDCLYCEPDGDYPNHHPNPQVAENMRDLGEAVRKLGADIGLAFDGDSDRVGVVDEQGEMIAADRILALLARDMLSRHAGASVVADVLSSQVLFNAVADAGGVPHMAASGHSLVKEAMREQEALLGGEMSGHIFLAEDYFGFDDGFMVAGRILQLLAESNAPLSALNADLPTLYSTPEYRPHCPDEDKQTVIDAVAEQLSDQGEVVTVDGVRIRFERGWGLLRASNTEPVLSLRFEGETEADALAYRALFADALKAFPQVESIE